MYWEFFSQLGASRLCAWYEDNWVDEPKSKVDYWREVYAIKP